MTLLLVALLAAAPLWGPGMVNTRGGGDSPFLLQRTYEMVTNLRAGVFPVRWMPDAAYGLGYPFFSYYAALPYYLAGALVLLGLDILTALKLVQTLGFLAAALAMYGWARRLTRSRWAAWLAAVAFTVAPFHLVNVYVRGDSLSEFYAFIFYPLILWGLDRIGEPASRRAGGARMATVALTYAGLILTHNLSFLIFTPFALLYLAAVARRAENERWRVFWIGLLALAVGILLSAWFLFPAAAELKYVQLGPSTQDYFYYSNHFRALNLVQWQPLFDYAVSVSPGQGGRSPFAMGLAQAVLAALGALALIVRAFQQRLDARWGFVLLGLLISTLMITPLSRPLWDHLPLLPVVQFPWRFLSIQALFAAATTAALVPSRLLTRNTRRAPRSPLSIVHCSLSVLIAALLTASTLFSLHPDRLPIGPADVTVERLQLYELFAGNIGTTIRYEWLPKTADPRPFTSDALIEPGAPLPAIPLEGAALETALVERKPTRQTWRVWGEGGRIAFPLLHWPGWAARVDGDPVAAWPVEGSGYLALEVPPGDHTVLLRLGRTPVRAAAEMLSLATTLALLAAAVVRAVPFAVRHVSFVIRSLVVGALFIGPLFILLLLLPRGDYTGDAGLTMDFHQMPYLHHNPGGVELGGARLTGYTLSAEELAPGDTLAITLDWARVANAQTATLRLLSPAAVRRDVEPLAEATFPLSPSLSISLSLPQDTPRGLYLLQLETQVTTEYLRPVRVPRGPTLPADAPVLARLGPAIRLHTATVSQPAPDRLAVKLSWSAARPVAANYAISLRLLNAEEQFATRSLDTQPGYGFLPTSMWRPGELVTDRYLLPLPDDLAPDDGYHLVIVLYPAPTPLQPVGQARVGDFALPLETPFEPQSPSRSFDLPPLEKPLGVDFAGQIRLAGYELARDESLLRLTLWWQALQAPADDYTVFVHLLDPATEEIVAQSDAMPRGGAYPTSWWTPGEVISETVTLSPGNAAQGTYRLVVGLYDRTVTRLPAIGPDGQRLPDDRIILPVDEYEAGN